MSLKAFPVIIAGLLSTGILLGQQNALFRKSSVTATYLSLTNFESKETILQQFEKQSL